MKTFITVSLRDNTGVGFTSFGYRITTKITNLRKPGDAVAVAGLQVAAGALFLAGSTDFSHTGAAVKITAVKAGAAGTTATARFPEMAAGRRGRRR